ncbi:MAG: hypothetical protein EAX90_00355 [Candidatus Heimdallarchaeota archaeon]|nr:hypothetical protein [Candidatus Heimdallarchaeota archaeon]
MKHHFFINRIDSDKLEILMTRGLSEHEAINIVVNGLLK